MYSICELRDVDVGLPKYKSFYITSPNYPSPYNQLLNIKVCPGAIRIHGGTFNVTLIHSWLRNNSSHCLDTLLFVYVPSSKCCSAMFDTSDPFSTECELIKDITLNEIGLIWTAGYQDSPEHIGFLIEIQGLL